MKRTLVLLSVLFVACCAVANAADGTFKLGIIGTTTSHVPAFVESINGNTQEAFKDFEVVAFYPGGTPDNPDSWDRVQGFSQNCLDAGLKQYYTIEEMLPDVDGILLESVDGRLHLEQAKPCIAAKKPLFIDKPMGGSLKDVLEIFQLANESGVPVFSASSLRYVKAYQEMRNASPIGEVLGADVTSPCSINGKHPSLYWYGVHGVESLFTIMGSDCLSVSRTNTPGADVVVGVWKGKKIGTFRGIRKGAAPYGAKVYGADAVVNVGDYEGYEPLLIEVCNFFKTGVAPIEQQETINIFAFMTAADMSRKEKGKSILLADAIKAAEDEKRVTVTIKTTPTSEYVWNDGESEEKTLQLDQLRGAVEETAQKCDVVRFILDNRAGIPADTIQKALAELDDARLANYIY